MADIKNKLISRQMNIKCIVCEGKGHLWPSPHWLDSKNDVQAVQTPKPQPDKQDLNKDLSSGVGLGVACWRCVGKGYISNPGERL